MVDLCIYLNTVKNAKEHKEQFEKELPSHGNFSGGEIGPLKRPN